MKLLVAILCICLSMNSFSQIPSTCSDTFFIKTYINADSSLIALDIITTNSNDVIGCGSIRNNSLGKFDDGFIIKWNKNGAIIWQKTFSADAGQAISKLLKLSDGNYVAVGSDGRSGNTVYMLLKFDENGNTLWQKEFTFPNNIITSFASLLEGINGEIFLTGYFVENNLSFNDRGYFIKFDASGNMLLSQKLTPPGQVNIFIPQHSLINNGYSYICGYHFSPYAKGLLMKVDNSDGRLVWSKVYDYNGKEAVFSQIFKYSANKLCIIGSKSYNESDTSLIFIIDTAGNVEISRSLQYNSRRGYGKATLDKGGNIIWGNFYRKPPTADFTLLSINPYTGINWTKNYTQLGNYSFIKGITFSNDSSLYTTGYKNLSTGIETFLTRFSKEGNSGCSSIPITTNIGTSYVSANTVQVTSTNYLLASTATAYTILNNLIKPANDICIYQVNCNTLKLSGPDTVCRITDSIKVRITKTKDCPLTTDLLFDSTRLSLYSYNDSSAVLTIRAGGIVKIKARIINRCDTLTDSIEVKIFNNPSAVYLGVDTVLCKGSSLTLRAGRNFKFYNWQDSSTDSIFKVNKPGSYFVAVADSCNNIYRDTINILEDSPSSFNLRPDTSKCNDDSIKITAPYGFTDYSWAPFYKISSVNGQTVTVFPAISTRYFAIAKKLNGCIVTDSLYITVNRSKPLNLINDTSICNKDSVILNAGNDFKKYSWSTGSVDPLIIAKTAGVYFIVALDTNNCISKDTFTLKNVYPLPLINLGTDRSLCRGTYYDLKPGNFASYLWQDNSTSNVYTVSTPGKYWVQVTDNNTCKSADSIIITGYLELPTNFLPDTLSMCEGEIIELKPTVGFKNYKWNLGSTDSSILIHSKGVYWLKVTNDEGCTNTDSTIISYKDCYRTVYFPTAFTPNEDGKNDIFRAVTYGPIKDFHLIIVNRFGEKVFETSDRYRGWDGKVNGILQDTGGFAWYCTYLFLGGAETSKIQKGTVVLLR